MTPEKPKSVTLAVQLLWISIAISFSAMLMNWTLAIERLTHQTPQLPMKPELFLILVWGITLAIYLWIIMKVSSGRNWARLLYLIMTVIGIPFSIPELINSFNTSMPTFLLAFIATLFSIVICVLLFTPPSNAWFRELKAQKKGKKN